MNFSYYKYLFPHRSSCVCFAGSVTGKTKKYEVRKLYLGNTQCKVHTSFLKVTFCSVMQMSSRGSECHTVEGHCSRTSRGSGTYWAVVNLGVHAAIHPGSLKTCDAVYRITITEPHELNEFIGVHRRQPSVPILHMRQCSWTQTQEHWNSTEVGFLQSSNACP